MSFQISKYLTKNPLRKGTISSDTELVDYGTCKVCQSEVYWSSQKLGSHKRGGRCTGQSHEELMDFKKAKVCTSNERVSQNVDHQHCYRVFD
jgi:hypothetical protein